MYKILKKEELAPMTVRMLIEAPRVAKAAKPGQFVIVIADRTAERVPLTIADFNREEGWVAIVTREAGSSTKKLLALEEGESIHSFVGPLGEPSDFIHDSDAVLQEKHYLFIGGGVGVAPVYPQVRYLVERGATVDVILGYRSKDFVILEEEYQALTNQVYIATDDGSYGFNGTVVDQFRALMEAGKSYDQVVAIGPLIMMKFAEEATAEYNLPITVSMNPIMVDGTGMCGACRLTVDGKTKFACVDGPEFDGHKIDFEEAFKRQRQYQTAEGRAKLRETTPENPNCRANEIDGKES